MKESPAQPTILISYMYASRLATVSCLFTGCLRVIVPKAGIAMQGTGERSYCTTIGPHFAVDLDIVASCWTEYSDHHQR